MFEGISPELLGAVRALASELRYRSVPSMVGRRVHIEGVDGIDSALRRAIPELPSAAALRSEGWRESLTLGKYGLLDLRYDIEATDAPAIGFRGLRNLGLLERDEDEGREDLLGGEVLAWLDECRNGRPLLKLFLQGPRPVDVVPGWMERRGFDGGLLAEYLPQELTVIDACETNGAFVWLLKHFYL